MQQKLFFTISIFLLSASHLYSQDQDEAFRELADNFVIDYRAMDIPAIDFDYRNYLRNIPDSATLALRNSFFLTYNVKLSFIKPNSLSPAERVRFKLLNYQILQHLNRCALEKQIRAREALTVPADGLSALPDGKNIYGMYIRDATGVAISPDEVYDFGMAEIEKIHGKIAEIQARAGFAQDSAGWIRYLNDPAFFLTSRDSVVAGYERIKARVLEHLGVLFEQPAGSLPDIDFMTWPDAGPYTPPGMYLAADENAYGKAVFQYNFYGNRHNRRAMDWMFLHEAIPGHHFQHTVREQTGLDALADLWFAGGTAEGWAAYVEYFGDAMGLYQDDWAWLGKWEWDLVRSVRIVISVGIHDRGWSKAQALAFWKANIPNQDEIAEREITRCTNWPGQVLTYKIGAKTIQEMRQWMERREGKAFDIRRFHTWFLRMGNVPLSVIEQVLLTG